MKTKLNKKICKSKTSFVFKIVNSYFCFWRDKKIPILIRN